jgi:hypothetical protein
VPEGERYVGKIMVISVDDRQRCSGEFRNVMICYYYDLLNGTALCRYPNLNPTKTHIPQQ